MALQAIAQPLRSSSSTQYHALGEKYETSDGRTFRYVKAGAASLVPGDVLQAPAVVTNHLGIAVSANAAIGDTSVSVTLGATSATANQYSEGWLCTQQGAGDGFLYKISKHPADTATALTVTLDADDALVEALTTSSTVSLIQNPYCGVIQLPVTTATGVPVGVATHAIATSEYGWIQTHGPASVQVEGTAIVGSLAACVTDSAGQAVTFSGVLPAIGYMMQAGIDEKYVAIFLTID